MAAPVPDLFRREAPAAARILAVAHQQLVEHGYTALTMDVLAHELGMSKKTLYVHFSGKDALIERIIECIERSLQERMTAVLSDPKLGFPQRIDQVVEVVGSTMTRISPAMLRELQRFAPRLYQKIEDVRQKNVPTFFGRLIREGVAAGKVRSDLDPAFATEFWLQAIRGLVQPAVLDRTQLTLRQTLEKALNLFLCGLLTPAGRKDYEKHLAA
ncbi:TetR/AcrR family transcriptional regulator [Opitutus terrae]|uniref:Transcriptional regulator, TetR family n=1 Tax=Opitutus terrae (strain DSM 11246 / JCM 15787 / PB90-1) TaxID=452637 RepID=B1ZWS6_OPITP|nr:TetR/AcrR family transcriptional regulator [Opitutus terrae]ACB74203.1 transcriptional regulator, TetR family [Opitutus terrae PB90-1]